MSEISLERVLAFNGELLALTKAGLPLDLGVTVSAKTNASKLDRINEALATRIRRGQDIEQAIAEENELTPRYRAALLTWLCCDDPTVALDGLVMPAMARRQLGLSIGQSMLYPLILVVLTYVGFLFLCGITVPKIEAIYQQIAPSPGNSLELLVAGRLLMPIWGPLVPLLLLAVVIAWRFRASGCVWLPARYVSAVRHANLSQQLARLLESGMSLQDSLALAGPLAGMPVIASKTGGVAAGEDELRSLPSLLRWAVNATQDSQQMPNELRIVAQTYRQTAQRQEAIWRFVVPSLCGILLGGAFVLCYSLSLFLPIVQLLKDISLPGGA